MKSLKMKSMIISLSLFVGGATGVALFAEDSMTPSTQPSTQPMSDVPAVLSFNMKSLEGKDVDLAKYKGKVILMVNTASKCGNTPQYAPLEAVFEKYKDKGFVILGFPSNDFGHQEPGTDADISIFCTKNYGVTFDMFSKIDVKGATAAPLYQYLTTHAPQTGDISWNFAKFLVSRDGQIVARYDPKKQPDSPEVISAIEAELAK
jgi:glutathione peroxidase